MRSAPPAGWRPDHDAIVVGSGPNGLAAAITLARAGRSVLVLEARETVGGGCRSAELTLPGYLHDVCSAVHPLVRAGSQRVADAMAAHLRALGGQIETGRLVTSLDDLPPARAGSSTSRPRQLLAMAGPALPSAWRRRLGRYGPGVCKVDWALAGPVPWRAAGCGRAGTVHLGGTMAEIAAAEPAVVAGRHTDRPYVILAQQTLARPVARPTPYALPLPGLYLCSSSMPPGGGVHGMCGHLAARAALRRELA